MILFFQIIGLLLVVTLSGTMFYSGYIRRTYVKPIVSNLQWLHDRGHQVLFGASLDRLTNQLISLVGRSDAIGLDDTGLSQRIRSLKLEIVEYLSDRPGFLPNSYHYYRTLYYKTSLLVLKCRLAPDEGTVASLFFKEDKGFDL